ncbi:putative inorganic phosphate cotransporter [Schistocerca serialis cubense]|uniref:putative inorganic phosphate cotransporter n=1 Tax=Schistocerca serialis cubense TaxID=2023355 RepID=UPI00214E2DE3|nr:putative inorganic phosphate cotransporter [Schistocerca serialis cubense]
MYDALPSRLVIGVQCFLATWCGFVVRICLSLLLLAMVYPSKAEVAEDRSIFLVPVSAKNNLTTLSADEPLPDYGPRYNWSQAIQGHVLAAYFYGAVVGPFPGGMLSEFMGARLVVGVTSLGAAVFTALCPLAAEAGVGWLIAARVLTGVLGGALYPSLHALVAQWSPPQEKGRFVWTLFGGTFGSVVTWPMCSAIIEALGWKACFYILGGIVGLWSILWFVTVYDSPSIHPRITPDELNYITTSIGDSVSKEKRMLPFWPVMTSCPFMALVALHFGNLGGLFFQLTETPKYMSEVLGFDLKKSGGFASLPHLMRLLFGIVFSTVGDWILADPLRNKTLVRKLFVIPSHLIPAVLMAALGYVGTNEAFAVALLSLSLGFNGAAAVTNLANHHDLAPNFAGSLYGIMNTIGSCTGFVFPAVVGYILEQSNTVKQWRIIFFIGFGLYFVSGLVFIIFGSAKMQPWNVKEAQTAS